MKTLKDQPKTKQPRAQPNLPKTNQPDLDPWNPRSRRAKAERGSDHGSKVVSKHEHWIRWTKETPVNSLNEHFLREKREEYR